jgi:hypothetical protein
MSQRDPRENQEKNNYHAKEAFNKVVDAFGGDREKAGRFMGETTPELRGESALSMIGQGRAAELNHRIDEFRGKKK